MSICPLSPVLYHPLVKHRSNLLGAHAFFYGAQVVIDHCVQDVGVSGDNRGQDEADDSCDDHAPKALRRGHHAQSGESAGND